ncbi:peptide deformylase [Nocardia jejuensis]|uniref:peptide deformylase n=1 Tax=Nocardia jejuensis TaxID=328049 RepID=UPI00082FBE79|nr:peptide deformylase [Nocardia jejuensis]
MPLIHTFAEAMRVIIDRLTAAVTGIGTQRGGLPPVTGELRDGLRARALADTPVGFVREQHLRTDQDPELLPSQQMAAIGIVQRGDPLLSRTARPLRLPEDADKARRAEEILIAVGEEARKVHPFKEGPGLNTMQLHPTEEALEYSVAVVYMPDTGWTTLYNPKMNNDIPRSGESTRKLDWEGCLSFFDERGKTDRDELVYFDHVLLDGTPQTSSFSGARARLWAHEWDHLNGKIYTDYDVVTIPIAEYRAMRAAEAAAREQGT